MSQRSQQPRIRQTNVRFSNQANYNTIQTDQTPVQQVYAHELTQETPNAPTQGQVSLRRNNQMSTTKNNRNQNQQFSSSKKQSAQQILAKSSQRCQSEIGAYPNTNNNNLQKSLYLQEQYSSSRARQTAIQFNQAHTLSPSTIIKKKQIQLSRQQQTYENAVKQIRQSLDSHSRLSKAPQPTNSGVSAATAKKFRNFHQNLAKSQHQTIDIGQQSTMNGSNLELTKRISQNSKLFGQLAVNSEIQKQQIQNAQVVDFQSKRNHKAYMNKSIDFAGISSYESMNFRQPKNNNFQMTAGKTNMTSQNMTRFHSQLQQFSGGESPMNQNQPLSGSRENDYQQKYFKERLLSEQMSKHIVKLETNYNELLDQNEEMKAKIQSLQGNQELQEQNKQNQEHINELTKKLEETQESLKKSERAHLDLQNSLLKTEQKLQEAEQDQNNAIIKNELELSNLNTKNKLLEDALTRRNVDVEQAEENNRQLLNLLEKYDNKLDELQEDNELKDMKIFEYERLHLGDRPKIKIESIEDKVKFLVMVLKRLRVMYLEEAQERVDLIKKEEGIDIVQYPLLPSVNKINEMNEGDKKVIGKDVTLDQATSKILKDMRLVEGNRQIREQLQDHMDADTDTINEGNGSKVMSQTSNSPSQHNLSPNHHHDTSSKKSEIQKLKDSKASLARDVSKKASSKMEQIDTVNISHQDIES